MAKEKNKQTSGNQTPHPGSSSEDAKRIGSKSDFGVPESNVIGRTYTSQNTKRSDPGGAPTRAGSNESRTSGVGGKESGVGSSSGGDLDTDIIGIGTGRGVAASGKIHEPPGPDDATGSSRDFAGSPHASGKHPPLKRGPGSVVQPADDSTTAPQGADALSNPDSGSDASAGEISSSEATGRDEAGGLTK